jgi:hypothetical protein
VSSRGPILSDRARDLLQKIEVQRAGGYRRSSTDVDAITRAESSDVGVAMSGYGLPRYQVRERALKKRWFKSATRKGFRAIYARDERGGYLVSLIFRVIFALGFGVGGYLGNQHFLMPETSRYEKLRVDADRARQQIQPIQERIKEAQSGAVKARQQLDDAVALFSSREFFRVRISEFFFELESLGGAIQKLCIGRLEVGKTLDPCETPSNSEAQAAGSAPTSASDSGYAALFKEAEADLRLQQIAGVQTELGQIGVDGVAVEILGDSQSYLRARQALVTDIPAISLLEESIQYRDDSDLESIRLVFSYPYSGE